MSRRAGIVTAVVAALVAVQSLVLWNATGRAGLTRYPEESRAAARSAAPTQAEDALADLLARAGLEADTGPMPVVDNGFRFGLLPSGLDRHAVSVLTIGAPAALLLAIGLATALRRNP